MAGCAQNDAAGHVVANALTGVQRALVNHVCRRVFADDGRERLAADVREFCASAFTLLEDGLANYAIGELAAARWPS